MTIDLRVIRIQRMGRRFYSKKRKALKRKPLNKEQLEKKKENTDLLDFI